MIEIPTSEIVKLRKATGAGMMDCKKALQESNGNFGAAVDIIRKKGQLIASKRADRDATEGVVISGTDGNKGAIIVLNCETDFVAKNENFVKLAQSILEVALKIFPENLETLKSLTVDNKTINEIIVEQIGIIGEKIDLGFYAKIKAEDLVNYNHPGNKLSTVVGFNKKVDLSVGKDIAMQIAAMAPIAVDISDVPSDVIEKEKEIGREQAKMEGKPENLIDKIAEGKLNRFLKEFTLLNQEFTKDNKKTIRQYLKEADPELGVTEFIRYSLR